MSPPSMISGYTPVHLHMCLFTPRTCARRKVIDSVIVAVVIVVIMDTKIAKSRKIGVGQTALCH